jgi:hypothetical protein
MAFELRLVAVPFAFMTVLVAIGSSLALLPRRAVPGVSAWLSWVWCYALGNLFFALRAPAFEPVAVPLRNGLWILAMGSLWLGCARYSGQKAKAWPIGVALLLVLPAQTFFTWVSPNAALRIFIISAAIGFGYAVAAWTFCAKNHPAPTGLRWTAILLFAGGVVFYGGRMIYALLWAPQYAQSIDTFATLVTWVFILVTQTVLSLLLWFLADHREAPRV